MDRVSARTSIDRSRDAIEASRTIVARSSDLLRDSRRLIARLGSFLAPAASELTEEEEIEAVERWDAMREQRLIDREIRFALQREVTPLFAPDKPGV
jgi:hypothetical protein